MAALSFPRFSWLWLNGKEKGANPEWISVKFNESIGGLGVWDEGEAENLRFYSVKEIDREVPSRKVKKKWKSREERSIRIDREYDIVLVPSDGVSLSGSESDDSDWSIGWLEPHAADFQIDDEADDDTFAVLVPCYRHEEEAKGEGTSYPFMDAVKNLPGGSSADGTKYVQQWLSSLPKF